MATTDRVLFGLAERVGRRLLRQRRRVTTAESCTGGWIAKALTDVPGSSQWFGEGFVTYGNEAKTRRLEVSRSILERHGAVSKAVAIAMAKGALRRTGAEVSVAVTGIAGPDGAVPGKPVGTVWFSWAERRGDRIRVTAERRNFRGDREAVRRKTVEAALQGLLRRSVRQSSRAIGGAHRTEGRYDSIAGGFPRTHAPSSHRAPISRRR